MYYFKIDLWEYPIFDPQTNTIIWVDYPCRNIKSNELCG